LPQKKATPALWCGWRKSKILYESESGESIFEMLVHLSGHECPAARLAIHAERRYPHREII